MAKPTQQQVKDLFEYRDGYLYWRIDRKGKAKAGTLAGSVDGRGYLGTGIFYRIYKNHRLIFLMHHGYLPKIVDHIDGNPLNNKIENLREGNKSKNMLNSKTPTTNKSGVKGVCWNKDAKKWKVTLRLNGIQYFYGNYESLNDAKKVVIQARKQLHGGYANHGNNS